MTLGYVRISGSHTPGFGLSRYAGCVPVYDLESRVQETLYSCATHGWVLPVKRRPWHPCRPWGCGTFGHTVSVQHRL